MAKRRSMKVGAFARRSRKRKMPEVDADEDVQASLKRRGKKSVEQTYQKKTPVEHILLRPDTYVGSVEWQEENTWVWNDRKHEMEYKGIQYVPALYKIFDEILVNAADNLQRDPNMKAIKVDIDPRKGRVKVWNDGKGLPVQIHKKHKVFVPELVFGHLLTSDNYDDSERKVTGGRNGYGAKLTNIFSKKFKIETADKNKRYIQDWENNMGKKSKPRIKKHSGKPYTCVEFWPDFKKFGMSNLDADTLSLMQRRVYDVAGTSGERCKVYLNGKQLPIKDFADYCDLYHGEDGYAYTKIGKRWEILVAKSDGDGFQQMSFCNSIATPKGGTHLQYVVDQLCDSIIAKAKRAAKGTEVKKIHVKTHLWVFVNCLIENPAFSSQTKEMMTLKASKFGSSCNLNSAFISEVIEETGILDVCISEAQAKMTIAMDNQTKSGSRSGKRVLGVPKLEDANDAGGGGSSKCTLILTEGDSAKALAVAGLSVIGRDKYGVFPLKGKPLNVRDVTQAQVANNAEIMNIVKILGLSFGSKGGDRDMRYGSVMIMADQDYDGSHIKGLLINLFHHWWPKLMKKPGFLQEFVTPIVKVHKDTKSIQFFTQTEYEKWKKKNDNGKGWKMKYYKGLGTSTAAEAKEYFSDIKKHKLDFKYKSPADGKVIDMAFNKARADDRKKWMNAYREGDVIDHSKNAVTYKDFVNKELVQFSRYDLMRSVPSVMDGLKPTQRKILFGCFKRNLKNDVKVAQLVGYVAEHASYHHGEASLSGAIVTMAQDFVGSNNINLLIPSGQFGTRIMGGKDAASARYIYTRLNPITRMIFSPLDDPILDYLDEEGQRIEPYWYCPVLPMVLVNGAEGIGTGWATSIPNYDPRDIIANLRFFIRRKKMKPMKPWYRGFSGTIKKSSEKGKWDCCGVYTETGRGVGLDITELPLRKWTQDYKEFLHTMLPGSDKKTKITLTECREYHTEDKVHFQVRMSGGDLKAMKSGEGGIEGQMRLKNNLLETNMVLFDKDGKIKKYKNAVEIMEEFAKVRLKYYDIRKKYLVDKLTLEKELLANRARFIAMIIAKKLHINNRKKKDIVKDLTRLKFRKFGDTKEPRTGYEYLLVMHIVSLTLERKQELEKLLKLKTDELNKLKKTSIQAMWTEDLDRLEAVFNQILAAERSADAGKKGKKGKLKLWKGAKRGKRGGKGKRGKRGRDEDDDDDEEGGGEGAEGEEGAPVESDNVFGSVGNDVTRWTSSYVKLPVSQGKRRRM